jgi:hypothetical protein
MTLMSTSDNVNDKLSFKLLNNLDQHNLERDFLNEMKF